MTILFSWIGVGVCVVVSIGFCAGSIGYMVDKFKEAYVNLSYKAAEIARRDIGNRLIQEAWWYSEDEAVMAALEIIGRELSQNGHCRVSDARDKWRERKGKAIK